MAPLSALIDRSFIVVEDEVSSGGEIYVSRVGTQGTAVGDTATINVQITVSGNATSVG